MISENELKNNLSTLREMLIDFNKSSFTNIIFFNLDTFYSFMDKYFNKDDKTVSKILKTLEPYIPLTLSVDDSTAELFLTALSSCSQKELKDLEKRFYKKAVFNFLETVKKVNNEKDMEYIFNLCNNLRLMQEGQ